MGAKPSADAKAKALASLASGASMRETARSCGVSATTVARWKAEQDAAERNSSAPKRDHGATERHGDAAASLLAEKDAQIGLLSSELARWQAQTDEANAHVRLLADALSEEREARRRADVMLQHALARPALPPSGGGSAPSGSRWEKIFFAVVMVALALLAIALLLR